MVSIAHLLYVIAFCCISPMSQSYISPMSQCYRISMHSTVALLDRCDLALFQICVARSDADNATKQHIGPAGRVTSDAPEQLSLTSSIAN